MASCTKCPSRYLASSNVTESNILVGSGPSSLRKNDVIFKTIKNHRKSTMDYILQPMWMVDQLQITQHPTKMVAKKIGSL